MHHSTVDSVCDRIMGDRSHWAPNTNDPSGDSNPVLYSSSSMIADTRKILGRLQKMPMPEIREDFATTEASVLLTQHNELVTALEALKPSLQRAHPSRPEHRTFEFSSRASNVVSALTELDIDEAKGLLAYSSRNPVIHHKMEKLRFENEKLRVTETTHVHIARTHTPTNQHEHEEPTKEAGHSVQNNATLSEDLLKELSTLRRQQLMLLELQKRPAPALPSPALPQQDPQLLKCLQEIKVDNEVNIKANQRMLLMSSAVLEANKSLRVERQRMEDERHLWRRERTLIFREAAELKQLREGTQREAELLAAGHASAKLIQELLTKSATPLPITKSVYTQRAVQAAAPSPHQHNNPTGVQPIAIDVPNTPLVTSNAITKRKPVATPRKLPSTFGNKQGGITPLPLSSPFGESKSALVISNTSAPKILSSASVGTSFQPVTSTAHTQTLSEGGPSWDEVTMQRTIMGPSFIAKEVPPTTLVTQYFAPSTAAPLTLHPTIPLSPEENEALLASGLCQESDEPFFAPSVFEDLLQDARKRKQKIRKLYGGVEEDPMNLEDPILLAAVKNITHELIASELRDRSIDHCDDGLVRDCLIEYMISQQGEEARGSVVSPPNPFIVSDERKSNLCEPIFVLPETSSETSKSLQKSEGDDVMFILREIVTSLLTTEKLNQPSSQPVAIPESLALTSPVRPATMDAAVSCVSATAEASSQKPPSPRADPLLKVSDGEVIVTTSQRVTSPTTLVGGGEITVRVILDAPPQPLSRSYPQTTGYTQTDQGHLMERSMITDPPSAIEAPSPPLKLVPLDQSTMARRAEAWEPLPVMGVETRRFAEVEEIYMSSSSSTRSSDTTDSYSSQSKSTYTTSRRRRSYRRAGRRHRASSSDRTYTTKSTTIIVPRQTVYQPSQLHANRKAVVAFEMDESSDRKLLEILEYEDLADVFDKYAPRHSTNAVNKIQQPVASPVVARQDNYAKPTDEQCPVTQWVATVEAPHGQLNNGSTPKRPASESHTSQSSTHLSSYGSHGIHKFYVTDGLRGGVSSSLGTSMTVTTVTTNVDANETYA